MHISLLILLYFFAFLPTLLNYTNRAEENAEKANSEIYWSRLLQYVFHVLWNRISPRYFDSVEDEYDFYFRNVFDDDYHSPSRGLFSRFISLFRLDHISGSTRSNSVSGIRLQYRSDRPGRGLLPVPFARSRLVEVRCCIANLISQHSTFIYILIRNIRLFIFVYQVIGSTTRVCFVDDDVICQGYSVTEEIFLLNSADTAQVFVQYLICSCNFLCLI